MNCHLCRTPLPADAPGGHCPQCLLKLALGAADSTSHQFDALNLKPGDRVGRYLILEQIGEGGCGVVFRAAQEEPMRREVALKIIKPGMDTREFIVRFAAERQALALLDHPNIARIFDAGATETGRPFLVMELVRGLKITDHADRHRLAIPLRLGLFLQVCAAVQHAHQKAIIHRDIKPSNILVVEDGRSGTGAPRIIDFGIAKSFEQPLTDENFYTAFQQYVGTPAYMSPEQAGLGGGEIDIRSDIYSLGVLLYELLAGGLPHEAPTTAWNSRDEFLRRVREVEPPRMSARVAGLTTAETAAIAHARKLDPSNLRRHLRGDLDHVVTKSLEQDRTRRYATVAALIGDIENYVHHRPVSARAPGNWQRLQKFARRNRPALAVAGALAGVLVLGVAASLYQGVRAGRAEKIQEQLRQLAENEAAKSAQETHFLADIFKASGPAVAMGRDTTLMREILDQADARIDRELAGQNSAQADLRLTLAKTYHQLGLFPQMEAIARKAIRDSKASGDAAVIARKLDELGDALAHQNKLAEAELASREALVLRRRIFGDNAAETGASLNDLGLIVRQQGRVAEAEQLFRAAIYVDRNLTGRDRMKTSPATGNLGAALYSEGRLEEAEAVYRAALDEVRARFGESHPEVATPLNNLATVLLDEGKWVEAEKLARAAVALDRKFLGNGSPGLAISLGNLGNILAAQKSFAEAESVDRESLAITRKLAGDRTELVTLRLRTLGHDLAGQGKMQEARALFSEAGVRGR